MVLIVEDDESAAELQRCALTRAGKNAAIVDTIKDALELLSKRQFTAIVLDYHLPDGDSLPVITAATMKSPKIPVVLVTGYGHESVAAQAINQGISGSVKKSGMYLEELSEVVNRLTAFATAQERLRLSEAKFRLMVEHVKDYAIFMLDAHGYISSWNLGAEKMTGYASEEAIGQHYSKCYPGAEGPGGTMERHLAIAESQGRVEVEGWKGRKNGTPFFANVVITAIRDDAGNLQGFVKVIRDVTEARACVQRISYLAYHDALTGLPNRALLWDRLRHACQVNHRLSHCFGLIFMDLNRFKEVNDTLGHAVGDELLVAVAQRLKLIFRDSDTIARLGGDEFVMLVEGLHNPSAMTEIANKINERISAPYLLHGETVNVSASLGTAIFPNDGEDSEALMEYADVNMYRAKQESKKQLALIRKS